MLKMKDGSFFCGFDLMKTGGVWLACARSWMQHNIPNGSTVAWGSDTTVSVTVKQLEEISAHAVAPITTDIVHLSEEIKELLKRLKSGHQLSDEDTKQLLAKLNSALWDSGVRITISMHDLEE